STTISSFPLGRRRTRPGRPGASGITRASREMPSASVTAKISWISRKVTAWSTASPLRDLGRRPGLVRALGTEGEGPAAVGRDLAERAEPDPGHHLVALVVRVEGIPIGGLAEQAPVVHPVEDVGEGDVLSLGEGPDHVVGAGDHVLGAGVVPEVGGDRAEDGERLVGAGAP